ncbi:uncharacterized protein LOC110616499 [Manihot esculenta]|nr:uncharacterized protein LOC110616499 [Manihot esculenta]
MDLVTSYPQLQLDHTSNQLQNPNATAATGQTIRNVSCCPLQVKQWNKITDDKLDHMWSTILEKFTFEYSDARKGAIFGHMNALYRYYRHKLKKKYFDSKATYSLRLRNKPKDMDVKDWKYLINLWTENTFQERRNKNKTNRCKHSMPPYTGTKSFARLRDHMKKKNGKTSSRLELFLESRKRKQGKEIDPISQEAIEKFQQLKKQREEEQISLDDDAMFADVLGPEKNSYIRAYGPKKNVTEYFSARPTKIELLRQLDTSRREANERVQQIQKEASEQVNDVKKQMDEKLAEMNRIWEQKFKMLLEKNNNIASPMEDSQDDEIGG